MIIPNIQYGKIKKFQTTNQVEYLDYAGKMW